MKSLCVTFFLWLFGGWFGLHHFYLGRDRHAFLTWCLMGGYFGVGWFRDLWWLNTYVKDANNDKQYIEELVSTMRRKKKPPFTMPIFFGEAAVGNAFGFIMSIAVPEELVFGFDLSFLRMFIPVAIAFGVHSAGNIGRQKGAIWWPLIGAYLTFPFLLNQQITLFWSAAISAVCFEWKAKQWKRTHSRPKPLYKRVAVLGLCTCLYASLWFSYLYFNAEIVDKDGEKIKFRDAVIHFFNSPMWTEFLETLQQLYNYANAHGWQKMWEELVAKVDPQGEISALKILQLEQHASETEITKQYRRLSREWHPDRFKDSAEKELAQEKFMEIQQAYERLSNLKARRLQRNQQDL